MRLNKDAEGNFTDEAIEAVERELKELAEKIQIPEEELGERIADNTFRQDFNHIEPELMVMRSVAVDVVLDRATRRVAQLESNRPGKMLLVWACYICAAIGIGFLFFGMFRLFVVSTVPQLEPVLSMNSLVPALVFVILFLMLMFASINAQAIDKWLLREIFIDLELAREVADSARDLLPEDK